MVKFQNQAQQKNNKKVDFFYNAVYYIFIKSNHINKATNIMTNEEKGKYPVHKFYNASFLQKLKFLKNNYPHFGNEPEGVEKHDYIAAGRDLSGVSADYYRDMKNLHGDVIGKGINNVDKYRLIIHRADAQEMFMMLEAYEEKHGQVGLFLAPDWENGPFID